MGCVYERKREREISSRFSSAQRAVARVGALNKTVGETRLETPMPRARNDVSPITKCDEALMVALLHAARRQGVDLQQRSSGDLRAHPGRVEY